MADRVPEVPERAAGEVDGDEPPWPIGFLILVGLAALYLGWRLIQLIARALEWAF